MCMYDWEVNTAARDPTAGEARREPATPSRWAHLSSAVFDS